MARRKHEVVYVPSVEIFRMSDGFGIEFCNEKGYSGQNQYRTREQVLASVAKWMDKIHPPGAAEADGT